jgi:hypothetical protein
VPRAVIDTARELRNLRDVRAIIAESVQRGLATPEQLVEELEHSHSAGSLLPRRAVEDMVAGARSAPEAEFRDLVLQSDVLPEPEWNARIVAADGFLIAIADAWWKRARMIAEINSMEHHLYGETWVATMRRQERLAAEGILVVPIPPSRIRTYPSAVVRNLERTYEARLAQLGAA